MLTSRLRHESESCVVMFPGAWWLGPLRWWVPWHLQGLLARVGRWQGKSGLMQQYVRPEDWKAYHENKKLL
jgi:hypothetical protein